MPFWIHCAPFIYVRKKSHSTVIIVKESVFRITRFCACELRQINISTRIWTTRVRKNPPRKSFSSRLNIYEGKNVSFLRSCMAQNTSTHFLMSQLLDFHRDNRCSDFFNRSSTFKLFSLARSSFFPSFTSFFFLFFFMMKQRLLHV